jgi:2-polyprenyl-3-methyl-5-hydroxy-6-metoxy-1,4-benzoquinol methylase
MSLDQVEYYDARWSSAPAEMTKAERERAEIALAALPRGKRVRILEIGSGRGLLSSELAAYGEVTSLDLSPVAMDAARRRWAGLPIEFLAGDFLEMRLPGPFDVAIALEVLEHVEDQSRFIDRIDESLSPGGTLILTTPQRWVAKYWAKQPGNFLQPVENWLSKSELAALLGARLQIVSLRPFCFNTIYSGPFRFLNAPKLNTIAPFAKLEKLLGWGMHLAVVARKAA